MNRRCVILAACACLTLSAVGRAFDTVKTTKSTMSGGQLIKMSPLEISYEKSGVSEEVPVNEVVSIIYDNEPNSLQITRIALANGRFEDALASLEKIDLEQVERAEIKQDVAFYKAFCAARLALGGNGDIMAAGKQMVGFVRNAPGSYHWLQANETVGDLLVASGNYAAAETYYTTVGKAPWPDYKMRAGVAVGRALLAQDKPAEALKYFDSVIGMQATGELADFQKMAATLGKARCMAAGGKQDDAIKMVQDIIAKADPESVELLARAYNTLGNALKAAGKPKEAILAFLHVDVLYFSIPDAHAEALANLAQLWNDVNKTERATRARRVLEERYKNSPWAK